MIVDTSALVAVFKREIGYEPIAEALLSDTGTIPAPVIVEFRRVTARAMNAPDPVAAFLIDKLLATRTRIMAFDADAAHAASEANTRFGTGGGLAGSLNLLDLMVYGIAKVTRLPILCTGKDFASTDALIHPASRIG